MIGLKGCDTQKAALLPDDLEIMEDEFPDDIGEASCFRCNFLVDEDFQGVIAITLKSAVFFDPDFIGSDSLS